MPARSGERMDAVAAAVALVGREFPACLAAFLAGSVVRGEATASSDLDILVIVPPDQPVFRESFRAFGWPVELFVQTPESHRDFAAADAARRRPSTSMMCCEGIVLQDRDGLAGRLKQEACRLLAAGPPALSPREIAMARYALSDLLDDFADAAGAEAFFIAHDLAVGACDLILDLNRRWRGRGKWVLRALRRFDPALAGRLAEAMDAFYGAGDPAPLVAFVDHALDLAGGRHWEGFRIASQARP